MKKGFVSLIFLLICSGILHAQEERELVKVRLVNSEKIPAAGFQVKLTPENIEATTDETGYFELDSSTKNTQLYIYNPYTTGYHWSFSITFTPEDNVDTIHTLTINWSVMGSIVDAEGKPISDVTVEVVGQNKPVITDSYGKFDVKNATHKQYLKISDPNKFYRDKVIQVSYAINKTPIVLDLHIPALLANRNDTTGVMYITDKTPQIIDAETPEIRNIKSFRHEKGGYTVKQINRTPRLRGTEILYRYGMDISWVGRLPELQNEYAQGQTNGTELEWQGAEKNEVFSWGPKIKNLEYANAASYPYDKNGSLAAKGSGNGIPANVYNSKDFFRTGISYKNDIDAKFAFIGNSILSASLNQNKVNSPIPNSYLESYKGGISLSKIETGKFTSELGLTMKHTHEKLMNNGSNYAQLLHAIYTTPATFDNSNGLSKKDAVKSSESWGFPNGSMRSYAPFSVYNPYYIVSNFPDRENYKDLLAYAKTKYKIDDYEVGGHFSYNKQWNDRVIRNVSNNDFARNSELADMNAGINAAYHYNDKLNFKLAYLFNKNSENVEYKTPSVSDDLSRQSHQISYAWLFSSYIINFELSNKHYFSNTANDYTNLFPYAGANINLENLWYKIFYSRPNFFENIFIFGSFNRSIGEAPLLYKSKAALSTNLSSSQFRDFYEWQEIPFHDKVKPEIYANAEVGIRKYAFRNKLSIEALYFQNTTWNFVSPFARNINTISLENLGRVRNYGYLFSASYRTGSYRSNLYGGFDINLNIIRSKVTSANLSNTPIALAGFSNIQTVFAKDEPLGAIYGTTYQRNNDGKVIIGNDGLPLVDNQLKRIGDPTPDFQLSFSPYLNWKMLTFSILMEYSHGGDRWNGTKAYLDYIGMSKESAAQRNIRSYIYDGVTQSGLPNAKPVDFYNPAASLSNNKWVRYGAQGVGEEYIEDASYFRIRDISLSCSLKNFIRRTFLEDIAKDLTIEAKLHNILLITSYKGVDPESTLFDYSTGKGLDLFNTPSSQAFSFSINLKF